MSFSRGRTVGFLGMLVASALALQGCTRKHVVANFPVSQTEKNLLLEDPFSPESQMTGIYDPTGINDGDALLPNNNPAALIDPTDPYGTFVKPCDMADYERELRDAMEAAAADATNKTIVVRYSYSLGTPFDSVALFAYNRSILRRNDDGITPIPVSPLDQLANYYEGAPNVLTYYADHTDARKKYVQGKRCFFDTVTIKSEEARPVLIRNGTMEHSLPTDPAANRSYDHTLNILYHGDQYVCPSPECWRRYLSPRLGKKSDGVVADYRTTLNNWRTDNPTNLKLSEYIRQCAFENQAQILPLFVADFREQRFSNPKFQGKMINRAWSSSATRRYEYEVKLKKVLDLPLMWDNQSSIWTDWTAARTLAMEPIPPGTTALWADYDGVDQLMYNIFNSGMNGTVTSTQYTPIVLDLPIGSSAAEYEANKHVRTSSMAFGTFFNLANIGYHSQNPNTTDKMAPTIVKDIRHRTAWVGGIVKDVLEPSDASSAKKVAKRRVATDGFLALPTIASGEMCDGGVPPGTGGIKPPRDSKGVVNNLHAGTPKYEILRGEQLFGTYSQINGRVTEYSHGFHKLREWIAANGGVPKVCDSSTNDPTPSNLKARYFGPWDGEAYTKIKVWVDANRDGKVDCGEMQGLAESRVAAINTCNLYFTTRATGELVPTRDRFGNMTHLRAAFLVSDTTAATTEDEIFQRLKTGKKTGGENAEFRVAVDLMFQVRENLYLEDVPVEDLFQMMTGVPVNPGNVDPNVRN